MAVRNKYKLSGRFASALGPHILTPTFMYECVPGESWSGSVEVKGLTRATTSLLLNPLWFDHFVFYIPNRLAWNEWPNFISQGITGQVDSGAVPPSEVPQLDGYTNYNDPTLPWFFSKQPLHPSEGDPLAINALPLYAYNVVWNKFFRSEGEQERLVNDTTQAQATTTPRDYHSRLVNTQRDASAAIPTGTLDDLRKGLAEDQFAQLRNRYGDKYTDYLRAVGVNASSLVLEDPEVVSKSSTQFRYAVTANTAGNDPAELGETSGYYTLSQTINLQRTFTAEHGLILGLAVARMEAVPSSASHPVWTKHRYDDYWSPEFQAEKAHLRANRDSRTFQANALAANAPDLDGYPERHLDYKLGVNVSTHASDLTAGGTVADMYFNRAAIPSTMTAKEAHDSLVRPAVTEFDGAFAGAQSQFAGIMTTTKLMKSSPIARFAVDPLR